MVRGNVVRHKIEDETDAALCEGLSGCGKSCRSPEMFINHIPPYTIRRSDIVLRRKVR